MGIRESQETRELMLGIWNRMAWYVAWAGRQGRAVGALTGLIGLAAGPLSAQAADPWITHRSFEDFAAGTRGNAGENLFISADGRIQMIHRLDLNNDGHIDLLVGLDHDDFDISDVLVYRGTKNGPQSIMPPLPDHQPLFRRLREIRRRDKNATRLPSDGGGRCLIVDLNGDKMLDIVFCNFIHNYTVHVDAIIYWGTPDGYTPRHRTRLPTLLGSGVAAADFNKDGFIDLAFSNRGGEHGETYGFHHHMESYIYWNGPLGFSTQRRSTIASVSAINCVAGDVDGDGYPELLFVNNNSKHKSVYLYWGDKAGFSEQRRDVLAGGDPFDAHFVDLNHDRKLDLVLSHSDNRVQVYHYDGRKISAEPALELPSLGPAEIESADLNRDGELDLVLANPGSEDQQVSFIYWGSSNGFSPDNRLALPTLAARAVAVADFNSDGLEDVAFGNWRDSKTSNVDTYIYWNHQAGFDAAYRAHLQGFGVRHMAAADLNDDSHPELVLINGISESIDGSGLPGTLIYWGNPRAHYSTASVTHLPTLGDTMASADFDQNGYVDMIYPNGEIYWNGPDGFSAANVTRIKMDALGVSTADVNHDGYLDLLSADRKPTASGGGVVGWIHWGSAEGFDDQNTSRLPLHARGCTAPTAADLNKDGYLDLLFPDGLSFNLDLFFGDATGTFDPKRSQHLKVNTAATVEMADLNGDGWLELLLGGVYDENNYGRPVKHAQLLWGSPDGYDPKRMTRLEAYESEEQVIADLNKDGFLDIVLTNYHGHTTRSIPIFIYWGNARAEYSQANRSELWAESSLAMLVADLNKDSWLDIVVHNHQERGDHGMGSHIFWGSPKGYDYGRRHWFQTFGVHYSTRRDIGDIYHRKLDEYYDSAVLQIPAGRKPGNLSWKATTPHGTAVKFQVRCAASKDDLAEANWLGPDGDGSFYRRSAQELTVTEGHTWIQYRAILTTPDGGSTAILDEVSIDLK